MRPIPILMMLLAGLLASCSGSTSRDAAQLEAELRAAETAFAATMAARDFDGFMSFIAEDAVFVADGEPLRGKAEIAARWKPYFEASEAPFSWTPEHVHVLASGTLGQSDGPVHDRTGAVTGRFRSIWRQERLGVWHVVFDAGYASCQPLPAAAPSPAVAPGG